MDANTEVLNFIFQNSEMGVNTLDELIEIAGDVSFEQVLLKQREGYKSINQEAVRLIEESEQEPKGLSRFEQIKTYFMLKISNMRHQSASHFAEMMIQGSVMGIIDLCKQLNSYKEIKPEIRALAEHLLQFEEGNVEELKKYLRQDKE